MTQQERRDYWQQHITDGQVSYLSRMAFCQQRPVACNKFSSSHNKRLGQWMELVKSHYIEARGKTGNKCLSGDALLPSSTA